MAIVAIEQEERGERTVNNGDRHNCTGREGREFDGGVGFLIQWKSAEVLKK